MESALESEFSRPQGQLEPSHIDAKGSEVVTSLPKQPTNQLAHSETASETTMNSLDSWLAATIGNPARRAAVRACVDSLDDFRCVELVDLEETIGLARWPVISRRRFVEAWKRL